jgi:hypothetical protein
MVSGLPKSRFVGSAKLRTLIPAGQRSDLTASRGEHCREQKDFIGWHDICSRKAHVQLS